jgi:hypothetical protein
MQAPGVGRKLGVKRFQRQTVERAQDTDEKRNQDWNERLRCQTYHHHHDHHNPPHKGNGPIVLTGYEHIRPNPAKECLREPKIGCILLSPGN